MSGERIDLGHGVAMEWFVAGEPPVRVGVFLHFSGGGGMRAGSIYIDTPEARAVLGQDRPFWQVHSLDPLTVSPSILARGRDEDGDWEVHGFIRDGKWVPA